MRGLIKPILLAATLAATTAQAGVNDLRTCERIGEIAVDAFTMRQGTIPADIAFRKYQGNRFSMSIVHDAYTSSRWYMDDKKAQELVDFKSKWVLWCMQTDEVIK